VWKQQLTDAYCIFHLAGINNQNFIMKDEETGSWWQQVTEKQSLGRLRADISGRFFWTSLLSHLEA